MILHPGSLNLATLPDRISIPAFSRQRTITCSCASFLPQFTSLRAAFRPLFFSRLSQFGLF